MEIKPYKKEYEYSYCLGAFPTIELIKARPEAALEVLVSPELTDKSTIEPLCRELGIPLRESGKLINKLGDKENVYIVGVFKKFECELSRNDGHIVLVNPGNMGNMGTMIRTAVGFGIKNLAIIRPAADIYNPKTVRASMGAVFRINFEQFESFEDYKNKYAEHHIYPFMLDGATRLDRLKERKSPFSLVFGNEATGLPPEFQHYGTSVFIPQSNEVDSLNITIAAAVAMYNFNIEKL